MRIEKIESGFLGVNTYFLIEGDKAVIIDGGERYPLIKSTAEKLKVKITHELLTHAHFDHSGNAFELQKDGVKIGASEIDGNKLNAKDSLADSLRIKYNAVTPDFTFTDGDVLKINGIEIKVMATPGHTDGSVCFIVGDVIFSGDTLFYEDCGRTDFATGSEKDMINSIKKILALKGEYRVLPGHGEETTLFHERKYNPLSKV